MVITDSTAAGKIMFAESSVELPHLSKYVLVPVTCKAASDGDATVSYTTVDGSAKAGMLLTTVAIAITIMSESIIDESYVICPLQAFIFSKPLEL